MQFMLKYYLAFLTSEVLTVCVFLFLLTLMRPRTVSLNAASLNVRVVKLDGENFIEVRGPPFNMLGAHQYLAYSVTDDRVELGFFVTRIALSNDGAFQSDWPLLIPQSKFMRQRVRLTCKTRNGEELVAIFLKTGNTFEIQRSNP